MKATTIMMAMKREPKPATWIGLTFEPRQWSERMVMYHIGQTGEALPPRKAEAKE